MSMTVTLRTATLTLTMREGVISLDLVPMFIPRGEPAPPLTDVDLSAVLHAAAAKNPPVDADEFSFLDSAAAWIVKKFTWAQMKVALWLNSVLSGTTSAQLLELRTDLAAGTLLTRPDRLNRMFFRLTTPATVGWIRVAEFINGDPASVGRVRMMGGYGSASVPSIGSETQFHTNMTTAIGNVFSALNFYYTGGSLPSPTGRMRYYYDTDGAGRLRSTLYFYQSSAISRTVWMRADILAGSVLDELRVWPEGDVLTVTDPAGTMTEAADSANIAGISAVDARLFLNTAGVPADPAKMVDRTEAVGVTAYTLQASDHMCRIRFLAPTTVTVTVPTGVISNGFYCEPVQYGAGQVVIVAGAGMTQDTAATAKSRATKSQMEIRGSSSTLYNVTGDMSAT